MRIESPLPEDLEQLITRVIGAAIEVHRHLGPGFLESIYEQALCLELEEQNVRVERQKEIGVPYKRHILTGQRIDILVDGRLILELKAIESLLPLHEAQLISYVKAMHLKAGLLINFNVRQLRQGIKRIVV
jgi:GxxExxY protein